MQNFIENILCYFESCFSRKAAFNWFVTITIGLMLRSDKLGITSVIRDLSLSPRCYDSMLYFFRASSWSLEDVRKRWSLAVRQYAPLYTESELHVLVGDGVKQSKWYEIQDRIPNRQQSAEDAVSGNDGYHEEMDRAPSGLGTDPFPVRDLF